MDGKIFKRQVDPTPIPELVFDLQRFDATCKIGDTEYESLSAAVSAANANDTIIMLKGETLISLININKNITLDLNGQTITGSTTLFTVNDDCKLTIDGTKTDSKITTSASTGIWLYEGANLELNGGEYESTNTTSTGNTYNTQFIYLSPPTTNRVDLPAGNGRSADYFNVSTNPGTITLTDVQATTVGRFFRSSDSNVSNYTLNVKGGTYKSTGTAATGIVFALGGMKSTFEDVTIESNSLGCVYASFNQNQNMTSTNNTFDFDTPTAEFTNCNFSWSGPTTTNYPWLNSGISTANCAVVKINSGTYTAKNGGTLLGSFSSGGAFVIEDGTFTAETNGSSSKLLYMMDDTYNHVTSSSAVANPYTKINGGTFNGTSLIKGSNCSITATGGVFASDIAETFKKNYLASTVTEDDYQLLDGKLYVGDSMNLMTTTPYLVKLDGVSYYYSTEELKTAALASTGAVGKNAVAQIGENDYYTTFADALTAAETGDTIKLLQATTTTETIAIAKTLTIDLNGKTLTDSAGITVNSGSTLNVVDSGTGGSLAAAITNNGTLNASSGKITSTVTNNGTFNMNGGSIETSSNAIENNADGTFTFTGGTINSGAVAINNKGTFGMKGGSILGKTGIKVLAGVLSILGGKIRGLKNGWTSTPSNVAETSDGSVTYEEVAASGNTYDGVAVAIAPEKTSAASAVTVTIGDTNAKADIDIAGEVTALNVGSSTGDATTDPDVTVALNDGKLSSVGRNGETAGTGAAISYNNANVQLNVDGVILENKFEIGSDISGVVGTEESSKVYLKSLAVNSNVLSDSSLDITDKLSANSTKLDGQTYSEIGGAVSANSIAEIGGNGENAGAYSSLSLALSKAAENSTVTLNKSLSISEQITLANSMTLSLGSNKLTYSGEGNAALKVTSGTVTIDDPNKMVDSNGNVLGIAIGSGATVKRASASTSMVTEYGSVVEPENTGTTTPGQDYQKVAKIVTSADDSIPTYFDDFTNAMNQLDGSETLIADEQATMTTLTYTAASSDTVHSSFTLSGLATAKDISISGSNFSITSANFNNATITNGGGYTFNLSTSGTATATSFTGSSSADKIINSIADLTINGLGGNDSITNSGQSATIDGGAGNDSITNETAAQVSIAGGAGDDTVINGGQSATILGGEGADNINNSGASSTVDGGAGNDVISNSGASSSLFGGAGNDVLSNTGEGTGTLWGGAGNDSLVGGSGADTFIYSAGADSIKSFGEGDNISLNGLTVDTDGSKLSSISGGFTFAFSNANKLTFESPTVSGVSLKSGTDTYIYKDTSIALGNSITLGKDYDTSTTFNLGTSFNSLDASALTKGIEITDNAQANYIVGGTGADTFNYSGGKDTIEGYSTIDVVNVADSLTPATSFSTTKAASVSYNGSDYVVNFDADNSLTFKATGAFALIKGNDTYSYTSNSIAKNNATEHGITLGSSYYTSKTFNGASDANSAYVSIDASDVDHAIRVTGNGNDNYMVASSLGGGTLLGGSGNDTLVAATGSTASLTLNGGEDSDSLVGGSGYNLFVYNGGVDSISGYQNGKDLASVASGFNPSTVAFAADDNNISLTFGDQDKLIFEGGASSTISLKSGSHTYAYSKDRIALDRSVTLTAGYSAASFAGGDAYDNINAEAVKVANGISITGNNNGNYIIGSASYANSLTGGTGDDTFRGGSAADIFFYTSGKDVIQNFGATDKLSITESDIDKARVSGTRLTFTMTDKKNTLTFRSDDAAPTSVSLQSGGYLTKDGVVKDDSLKLFSSAKGRIDYGTGVTSINASAVDKQSVTLVGGSEGGAFTFATDGNKKRDGFEYGGGAVSISNYESGRDRINLGDYSISGFTVNDDSLVAVSLGNASGAEGAISLIGAKGSEVMIHQNSVNRGNSYSRMVFDKTGVVYDKAASKATNATIWGGMNANDTYNAGDAAKLKKITLKDNVEKIAIQAGGNNTVIDASKAGAGISLYSGAKNDKFTGSANADMFVYTAGKDIIQDFNIGDATDQISLSDNISLESAKITANKKSIKFKFGTKDALTIKPTKGDTLSGELTIDGDTRTYGKNSIAKNGNVTLTSKFGGTYNVSKSGGSTIDGGLVSKKLTFKGTDAAESLIGGSGKTMFKGGGGNDTLQGGSGADTFFYAKGDKGSVTVADFDFTNDKLKIAGGTLAKVSTIEGGVQFAMKEGRGESPEVGWFNLTSFKKDNVDANKVLIKTNNTYYWFADGNETLASSTDDSLQTAKVGALITSTSKISNSQTKGYDIIELNYSTNLVRSNVAVQVKDTLKSNG